MGTAIPGYYVRMRREHSRLIFRTLRALLAPTGFQKGSRHAARAHCAA